MREIGSETTKFLEAGKGIAERTAHESPGPEDLFAGWFNNKMTLVLMAIERPRPLRPGMLWQIRFFLGDIWHHYTAPHGAKPLRNALRYLRVYFRAHPDVNTRQSRTAFRMAWRLHHALGRGPGERKVPR